MEFHDRSISKWEDEPKKEKKESKTVSSQIEKEKKMKLTFRVIPLMESHGQSVPKREDEPKKEKTKESKWLVFGMKRKKKMIDQFQSWEDKTKLKAIFNN